MKTGAVLALLLLLPSCLPIRADGVRPYAPEPPPPLFALANATVERVYYAPLADAEGWTDLSTEKKEVAGRAPAGWFEASTWTSGKMTVSPGSEDALPFLHWECPKIDYGQGRLGIPLGPLAPEKLYRITLRVRGLDAIPVTVEIAGRDGAAKPVWHETELFGSDWKTVVLQWRPSVPLPNAALFLSLDRKETLDVAELSVDACDTGTLRAALEAAPAAVGANDLAASRFPFGLPAGWMLGRNDSDGDGVRLGPDPAVTGPSGSAALHVAAAQGATVYGAPFAVTRFWLAQTLSFAVRGDGSGSLRLRAGERVLAEKAFAVASADGWKRISVPFTQGNFAEENRPEIELKGDVWIDAVRSGIGADYAPQMEAEVALGGGGPGRFFFDDAPDQPVSWAAFGVPAGAVLRAKAVDIYGEEIALPPASPAPGKAIGSWALPVFPGHALGSERIEAWVEDAAGKRVSPYADWVVMRLKRPRHWGEDAPDSPFGVHVLAANRELEMAKAIGINWVRLHDAGLNYVGWSSLEAEKGEWTFHDTELQRYRAHYLMILGELGTAPAWASGWGREGTRNPYLDKYYEPDDLDDFRHYVLTATTHYRDMIRAWEIWNEPWGAGFWKTGYRVQDDGPVRPYVSPTAPADYARLMEAAYRTAKEVDPGLSLIGFNSTAGNYPRPGIAYAGTEWTRGVLAAGGLPFADVFSYHDYTLDSGGFAEDAAETGYRVALAPFLKDGAPPLPVWMTEGSSVAGLTGRGFYAHTIPFSLPDDDASAADRLCRYVVSLLSVGDKKVFLYSMHKYGGFDNGGAYRLLVDDFGYLHPSAAAFSALAWRLEDKVFVHTEEVTPETRAYVFQGASGWAAVLIPRPGAASTFDPGRCPGAEAADLYGNPLGSPGKTLFTLSGAGTYPGLGR